LRDRQALFFGPLITQGNSSLNAPSQPIASCPSADDAAYLTAVLVHNTHFVSREGPKGFVEIVEHFAGGADCLFFCRRFVRQLDPDLIDLAFAIVVMEEIPWQ
jgi:hypothetical protein